MRNGALRSDLPFPPYDPSTRCPKCDHAEVSTHYRPSGCGDPKCWTCEVEHLLRVCQRCRFSWPESPAPKTAEGE